MLNTIIKKFNNNIDFLFICSYTILLFADIMYCLPIVGQYNKYIILGSYVGMSIFILLKLLDDGIYKVKEKKYIILFCIALIIMLCYFFTKDATFIRLLLLVSCVYFLDFDSFVRADVSIKITLIISAISLCIVGIIPDKISYRADKYVRHSIGFKSPNLLSLYLTTILFEVMYLRKNKRVLPFAILVVVLVIFEYVVLNTKTTALVLPIGLLFYIIYEKKQIIVQKSFEIKFIKAVICGIPFILSIASVLCILIYNISPEKISFLDKLTSRRIEFCTLFYNIYGISILGNVVPDELFNHFVLDNMYLKLLIRFGIIQFIIFMSVLILNTKKGYVCKKYDLVFFIVLLELYGVMESIVMIPGINIFILYFASNFIKEKNEGK